ncbi:helix-turn-helix domain-containing protein [Candidatus Falkowbacteria bacterium]|uniref:Resolvase HTH domain-containing protein n=1 Tax=Candidatus Falkowbacteria bacterium CG10_big_fil_rev_8_21_14_0_10_37_18 TaxID=1974562 RepID=A0A2H0VBQ3_9BACT|nr:helix-turn-helix domain-containing protein [Candidatus Falkowbacteria bacterium]NCQ12853.1 helix-turn-helix domain-containing protein [Candidatus Falkowbacteria bacterium]OIO05439.1 MAG: hypothetical protein AUJ26_03115 [Candidatus Falkowbacteria bacterium CG1_02_37_21]PIR95789.1 MAG: hypothetical protein COT93_00650 [Candidatus Falkowbacteria bacterium CG10_big_fil_rev_8_21_14_0_10_37_18]
MVRMKAADKLKAIKLRKEGHSYSEILREVHVTKSTLSLWLRKIGLSRAQRQRLTDKKMAAMRRGWEKRRQTRILLTARIKNKAHLEIGKVNKRELWLLGAALYWAEGSKQKEHCVSTRVIFSNSDPFMIKVFLVWLQECCHVNSEDILFSIYFHESALHEKQKIQQYWSQVTGFSIFKFKQIFLKRHKVNTNRKNIGKDYFGLLKIIVKKSTNLNRKISGWVEGIYDNCGIV